MAIQQGSGIEIQDQASVTKPKHLRVRVVDNAKDGRPAVNVNLPIGIRAQCLGGGAGGGS